MGNRRSFSQAIAAQNLDADNFIEVFEVFCDRAATANDVFEVAASRLTDFLINQLIAELVNYPQPYNY